MTGQTIQRQEYTSLFFSPRSKNKFWNFLNKRFIVDRIDTDETTYEGIASRLTKAFVEMTLGN